MNNQIFNKKNIKLNLKNLNKKNELFSGLIIRNDFSKNNLYELEYFSQEINRLNRMLIIYHEINRTQEKWDNRKLKRSIKCDIKLKRSRI